MVVTEVFISTVSVSLKGFPVLFGGWCWKKLTNYGTRENVRLALITKLVLLGNVAAIYIIKPVK